MFAFAGFCRAVLGLKARAAVVVQWRLLCFASAWRAVGGSPRVCFLSLTVGHRARFSMKHPVQPPVRESRRAGMLLRQLLPFA